ncbi:hypothetical protein Poli38472_002143 [Pythium oligandrum]|uniref:Uncharacterized protein n=1 Tax=Pythium oligandrum TaxID=41045 RepID=A0A8K1CGZ9_PYTOL|nr:hypothetical protein Poli38472_002143 [Pythium oligandrum]|eukprot:TMW63202.1 hypothetical protein Poli38472_002143 [Pythium oligandrum]
MDLPDEELKQPLVPTIDVDSQPTGGITPTRSPKHSGRGGSPKRKGLVPSEPLRIGGGGATGAHYVAMRGAMGDGGEEEEKEEKGLHDKRQLPYAAPNVHPYAVPQYQPNAYGGRGGGWGGDQVFDQSRIPAIDIIFSGMYTLAAALTVIQGFGMLIQFSIASIILGLYTMAFGCVVILYDLKSVVYGVSVEQYFPFLGNYIGRALTISFFAALCAQTYTYSGWTKFIMWYNLVVATLQGFVHFTTRTVTPTEHSAMEDLPDL